MATQGERIAVLETLIPELKEKIDNNHKDLKEDISELKALVINGNGKSKIKWGIWIPIIVANIPVISFLLIKIGEWLQSVPVK